MLVAEWKFERNTVAGEARDSSGNDNHGTIDGATKVAGKFGNCLSFDGIDNFVDCGSGASLDNLKNLSVSVWVYTNVETGMWIIDGKDRASLGWHMRIYSWSGGFARIYARAQCVTAYASRYSTFLIPNLTWTHVTFTYNNTTKLINVYINGVLANGSGQTGIGARKLDAAWTVYIGARNMSGVMDSFFNGKLDEVRVYDKVLNVGDVKRAMLGLRSIKE